MARQKAAYSLCNTINQTFVEGNKLCFVFFLQVYKVLIKLPDGRSYFIFRRYNEFHQMCDKVCSPLSSCKLISEILVKSLSEHYKVGSYLSITFSCKDAIHWSLKYMKSYCKSSHSRPYFWPRISNFSQIMLT